MTCGKCNDTPCKECCNPNIVAGECIDIDVSKEGKIIINGSCPTVIESEDKTVKVKKISDNPRTYDLSVKDKNDKVAVCSGDETPWTLNTKIKAKQWSPITVDIVGCPWENARMEIGFNKDLISFEDKKVAVKNGCPWDYLGNVIQVNSKFLSWSVQGCKYVIQDADPKYYYGKLTLTDTVIRKLPAGVSWVGGDFFYLFAWDTNSNGGVAQTIASPFTADMLENMELDRGMLKAKKKGIYNVSFSWAVECSFWVHALRVIVYIIGKKKTGTIIESRYSAETGNPASDKRIHPLISYITDATGTNGKSSSLGHALMRMPFGGSTLIEMDEWDRLLLGLKVNTILDYLDEDFKFNGWATAGERAILGRSGWHAGSDSWASLSAFMVRPLN